MSILGKFSSRPLLLGAILAAHTCLHHTDGLRTCLAGDFQLSLGDLEIQFDASEGYTVAEMLRNGRQIIQPAGGSGTVIEVWDGDPAAGGQRDPGFVGSVHHFENILETRLLVDGVSVPLMNTEGSHAVFCRRSQLADAYELLSILTVTADQIDERVIMRGLDGSKWVTPFYGFLNEHSNRLTDYAAFDSSGTLVYEGQLIEDNFQTANLFGSPAVAQYDPIAGDGILTQVTLGEDLGLQHALWEFQDLSNKLYATFHDAEGWADPENEFAFHRVVQFLDAPDWKAEAQGMLVPGAPLTGDTSSDGKVDIGDFTLWSDAFGETTFCHPADVSYDHVVDIGDFTVWVDNLGSTMVFGGNDGGQGANAVPEPSTLGLLAIGMIALVAFGGRLSRKN